MKLRIKKAIKLLNNEGLQRYPNQNPDLFISWKLWDKLALLIKRYFISCKTRENERIIIYSNDGSMIFYKADIEKVRLSTDEKETPL